MKIIGISGTNGSGKDSLGQMLAERHGYLFVSVTDILREGLREQNQPIERKNLRNLSTQWRREHGLGVLVDKAVEKFKESGSKYRGLAIASLRNPGEADKVHELGGKVIWLDADPQERYERIHSRHRSTEDQKTYGQFLEEEQAEMQHEGDEATLSLAGVKTKADIFIRNDGNKVEQFIAHAEKILNLT
jgi:cytidylate kinase